MKKVVITLCLVCISLSCSFSQNGWVQLANYPGSGGVGNTGYNFLNTGLVGLGYWSVNTNNFADVWEWDPIASTWTARASFPASTRYNQCGFSLGKKAYICLGSDAVLYFNDLWEYDGGTNTWTQKANFMGSARYGGIGQGGGGNKAWVGLGEHDNGNGYYEYCKDFFEYDWSTNAWTQKADYPGEPRFGSYSFFIDNTVYVVGGRTETPPWSAWIYKRDVYAYDIATNTWTQKADYPGQGSMQFGGFVLGQYAYMGTGYYDFTSCNDFWRYDPQNDTWLQLANFPGGTRRSSMYFNIGNFGYLGCGRTGSNTDFHDFWRFEDLTLKVDENAVEDHIRIWPDPATDIVNIKGEGMHVIDIYSTDGTLVSHTEAADVQNTVAFDISGFAPGCYFARIGYGNGIITKKIIKI